MSRRIGGSGRCCCDGLDDDGAWSRGEATAASAAQWPISSVSAVRPWSGTITFARPARSEWEENACAENIVGFYFDANEAAAPRAKAPDF